MPFVARHTHQPKIDKGIWFLITNSNVHVWVCSRCPRIFFSTLYFSSLVLEKMNLLLHQWTKERRRYSIYRRETSKKGIFIPCIDLFRLVGWFFFSIPVAGYLQCIQGKSSFIYQNSCMCLFMRERYIEFNTQFSFQVHIHRIYIIHIIKGSFHTNVGLYDGVWEGQIRKSSNMGSGIFFHFVSVFSLFFLLSSSLFFFNTFCSIRCCVWLWL